MAATTSLAGIMTAAMVTELTAPINQARLSSAVTFVIYNSAGTAVKTMHGAGA